MPVLLAHWPRPPVGPPEESLSGVLGVWRADTVEGGSTPTQLTDVSGAGRHLTASGVTIETDGGVPYFALTGSAEVDSLEVAPWKPMHDGTGVTWWAVVEIAASGADEQCLWDTAGESAAWHGALVKIDRVRGRLNLTLANASGTFVLSSWYSFDGSFAVGTKHVIVATLGTADSPDAQFWIDGRLAASLSLGDRSRDGDGLALSTSDPDDQLRLFRQVNNANGLVGKVGEMGIATGIVSTAHRRRIEDWAASRYGVTLLRSQRGVLLFDGNSHIDDFWRVESHNRNILPRRVREELALDALYLNRAVAGAKTEEVLARAAKHVTPSYTASAPWNVLVVTEIINSLDLGETKEDAYAALVSYCQARQAEGWLVVVMTPLPHNAATTPQLDDIDWCRDQIVANWATFADAIAPVHEDEIMGDRTQTADTTYRYDGVHHTDAANERLVPYVVAAIESVLP
jgi:hypothetical protein